ncbi:MAG TPA: class I SAM-dependent methyltransferase [Clostridia bacterium]
MKIAQNWKDYQIIATGDGQKLERWGNVILLRPDPQVIWRADIDMRNYPGLNAVYLRSSRGGGRWQILREFGDSWTIKYKNYTFLVKPTGFKHTGLFPEQAVNWDMMEALIKKRGGGSVLNLFAYTGAASVVCACSGAKVTHVDAAKGMVERAKENAKLNNINTIRYIVDDCLKFVNREIKRGNRYDAIIMDPPSYGRGPNGEMWKLEDNIFELAKLCSELLSDNPLFYLINSYTTGLQPSVMGNILKKVTKRFKGRIEAYEVVLPTQEKDIVLPCGASAVFIGD